MAATSHKLVDRIKGAVHVVHGLGDLIRGTVLDIADTTVTPSASAGNDNPYQVIIRHGKEEYKDGLDMLLGRRHDRSRDSHPPRPPTPPRRSFPPKEWGTEGGIGNANGIQRVSGRSREVSFEGDLKERPRGRSEESTGSLKGDGPSTTMV
ncbi:hypothetical protein JAAARDRAFT_193695 [Jaapia argillacea MUCL 33604]|uniref:Uncharacterized protein n=1 Tax=Jaapia argillacea MUCL 33604 TaxID=933084 RepID=A0A067PU58_9AGAM|nr:hypothetical protein JAAARDRAFT_193695 [Jaapia argillacea MUCL 33604]